MRDYATPVTKAILVLQMTDLHHAIFHLMLADMIASLVLVQLDKHTFNDYL